MKVELFKKSFTKYSTIFAKESSDIPDSSVEVDKFFTKYGIFSQNSHSMDEKDYLENYCNPMCCVHRENFMIVLEKNGEKISLKFFESSRHRRFGVKWFRISTQCTYFTFDLSKGDLYTGYIIDYHKKRKCKKHLRKNYFSSRPLQSITHNISSGKSFYPKEMISEFTKIILQKLFFELDGDPSTNFTDSRLLEFYLKKKQIKYPNNFHIFFLNIDEQVKLKELRKSSMKLVDAYMNKHGLFGETIKKILHNQNSKVSPKFLSQLLVIFPTSWVLQDKLLVEKTLTYNIDYIGLVQYKDSLKKYMSTKEFKNLFSVIKDTMMNRMISLHSILDHIQFYLYLREVGENVKWKSDSYLTFKDEHLDFADLYEHYKRGFYKRIYPDSLEQSLKIPIIDGDDVYYPIVLKNSDEYNLESQTQSNCVKGYIGRPSSLIVSLRKNSIISDERATIEYQIFKEKEKIKFNRPQSLGKYNSSLDETWNSSLKKLDERIGTWIESDKNFVTVKLEKEIVHNGTKLYSDSDWSENGFLFWTYNVINKENYSPVFFQNPLEF